MLIQIFFEPNSDDKWHFPGKCTIKEDLVISAVTLLNADRESKDEIENARIGLAIPTFSSSQD